MAAPGRRRKEKMNFGIMVAQTRSKAGKKKGGHPA
jgi:hypothetical protein